MFKMFILVLSIVSIGLSSAQLVQNQKCDPNINLVNNFDVSKFLGKWHVVRRTEKPGHPIHCSHLEIVKENEQIHVHERVVNQNFLEEAKHPTIHHEGTAKFTINRPDSDKPKDFWILSTDYLNFTLAYACEDEGSTRKVTIWQLGRETSFPQTGMVEALMNQTLFNTFGITRDQLTPVDHSEKTCKTLPEIPPGQDVILPGQCNPNMPVVKNFDVPAFMGEWIGISSYYSVNQVGGNCGRAKYTLSGGVVIVENSMIVNQQLEVIRGSAVVNTTDGSARLLVTLEIRPGIFVDSPLWILATDYNNYAVSYTCVDLPNNQKRVNAWIVSRTRQLSSETQIAIENVINSEVDLNKRYFIDADNSDQSCFYFPEPTPGKPVVFPGQCDMNITAMAQFNAIAYMGLWHNIESYPSVSSNGSCNNALYTLKDGFVDVFNTEVKNQQLLTINGVARVASTDGSAKLTVDFPIAGTDTIATADYWVLDTDYISYALVYSCLNINENQQQVTSFKLSRTKSLSIAGAAAINRTMEKVQVLDQRYFERNDQSRGGCFYYPEPKKGVPVVFPGQCSDTNVQVVQSFDLTRFQGTWNEIQAYPKEQQPGQCVAHEFTATSTGFNLRTTGIIDQFMSTSTSVVARAATDGSAKFNITINPGITIPYWIVDTDYSNYALAYSCMDINSDFRAVYSWKLSRTKQLSTSSMTAINNTMQGINVLGERYFETVDQSDSGCFYLPELPPGEPVVLYGQCDPNIQVVQNFNAAAYLGLWRRISSYPEPFQIGKCNQATYSLNPDGSTVDVYNTQVINGQLDFINGTAVLASTDGSAKLWVNFPITPEPAPYWVLDTDYTSFALVYSCRNLTNNQRRVASWILSRTTQLTASAIQRINQVMNRIDVLNNRYFEIDDQSDEACFYLPEPGPNTPIFRGQCDETIPAVSNFNAASYLGQWYDIASYSTVFQEGTCNSAFYSLGDGVVDVYNTQVVNQTLDTMTGIARVVSTDGSAKLDVTFPIVGTNMNITTPYWVLATDYQSFSLVYTCVNIDEERRQVWSWMLSRTRELTSDALSAINRTIANVNVLDDRYYKQRDHSREGCFYNPEPQPGVPVVFPGQCDMNIQAISDFNMTRFQGIWYEIEAYPKIQQTGQCVNHEYTLSGNTFNLVSTSVLNQIRDTTNSRVTFASVQDTSGRLNITLTTGGSVITIPFWIIDTDYTSYALAYSCVNNNDDFRGVFSWKLSRTQQLTTEAATAIDNAMQRIDVLQQRYFEPIRQTDEACFYLPEHVPGQPVTFPGRCDESISVVQNFNAAKYLGRWRRISSYPEPSQIGQCNQATYSLNPDGSTVDVYNTQVISGELDFINGTAVLASTDGSAKLWVNFPNTPERAPYWVLDTDYDSFALVYSCRNLPNNQRRVTSWKLSRTTELTASAIQRIDQVMNRIDVLNDQYFEMDDQSDQACFYLPEPGPNTPIFRGQCDENIPVIRNFDAAAYLGQWYDIASYNTVFQQGTCNSAFYSLGDGVVDVYNTQVVNQTLDTMTGIARVVSTDGSAKLNVTFPIVGTNNNITTPYWVIATDYRSFSLVYTCVNIDEERRQVFSWKLSRSTQLTNAAVTAINNAVASIPVLDERYYVTRDHSSQGCFYYPEPEEGKPVVFPGQCDATIQAVANFDMTAFQGIWHEIEAYPKDQQSGQCINHQYTLTSVSSNSLNLVSSNVINETLGTTNSRVTFESAQDSSGRLVITLTSAGTTITIPFWILSIDYNDHALAYSCVNITQNQRAVYSWKLSRSKVLSAAGNTAINNKISEIDVLHNKYYEKIGQSDNACFYLPDIAPGQPVIFNGQCDRSIPVVQNFNAARYLGRWRMIETYPSDFQSPQGGCQEANYALGSNGVDVFNTQVINQVLDTINGTAVVDGTDGSGRLLVNFPGAPTASEYWILDTDYDSFALVYSCVNVNSEQRRVWTWKLSRTRELTSAAKARIDNIVNSINVLNEKFYIKIDHSDNACFYYPIPDGKPVEFRGQCDQNLPVVTGFNAVAYEGLWHSIESYPTQFGSQGECGNALYTLRGGVVEVYNTQVINQRLDTINGTATLVPTADGSAKLIVRFPAGPTFSEAPYWVLDTDYRSYSLVYTCVDISKELRRVSSWILSRTRQLTAEAATAVNRVINTVPVLDARYYEKSNQSDESCFYYPDPQPGVPVVFRGQCDDTIQAVPNFNMNAFQGVWHEIEAYPKEQQSGQCINHEYTVSGNGLDLVSSNIIDQIRSFTNSRVTFASAQDTSGKLNITLTSGGQTIIIPFWVLSTDYNDYALAYSCVNLDANSRGVFSWKLSRSQQLSTAATVAINNKINEINVLDNMYYEKIGQSNTDCFFLSEYIPGVPMEFVGQCDEDLPVMQNFNLDAYEGRWRMIESYASEFQGMNATCLEATYTRATRPTTVDLIVYNTEVVREQLQTVNGTANVNSTDGSGKLSVRFPTNPRAAPLWVLDTDYTTYALVYSCRNIANNRRRVWTGKLSRTRELTENAKAKISEIVNKIDVLNEKYYEKIAHSDAACFYYPTPDGNPVVLRGQCDQSIPVVAQFDVAAYLGTWYDIEGYPVQFQDGTCPTATYTLGSDGVDVYNTQVVGQQLDTIRGSAVVASTDGLAKLTVTFPVAGTNLTVETPYWVLATDYVNYSLVYTCVDIDPERRRVASWMLSRTKTLSAESRTAINRVIATVPVLREDYYSYRGHSKEDCFYYPDNEGGPVILDGQCDLNDIDIVDKFYSNAFAGSWYEISRFPSELQDGECVSNEISFENARMQISKNIVANERKSTFTGPATVSPDDRGIITATLTDPVGGGVFEMTFYVLAVDYADFALLYGCRNVDNSTKQIYSWKLSRSQTGLSDAAATRISEIVRDTMPLFDGYYGDTDQTVKGCFHYPRFDELPPSIELIGPCDTRITAKPNFNVAAYLGKWYEIASYPQAFQFGQCARAQYSLGDNVVNVINTQVVNKTLDLQTATAVVASTDGSGLLNVTFNLPNGVVNVVNYYVLETDYNNFALVYSCSNLPSGNRQVSSWILSRQTTLSQNAVPIIDRIINETQGLKREYYRNTSQTEDDCFYIPEVNKNEAPVFRGQCGNISGVEGFDIQKYLGWWHEIESYPTDNNRGACISSEFIQIWNEFHVVDTNIFNNTAQVNTSVVTVTTDGRLRKINNGVVTDIWVLATDYETYSLLYSCENVDSQYMRVWSAKHSKTRQLTADAQEAMSRYINSTRTLETQFYQVVDQSDSACFHYPEQTGNRIIIPGQCDLEIPVVQNFDVDEYSGTWYQIERYPQIHENGTCIGARYTLNKDTGVVTVLNWQVVDEVLDEVEGTATINSTDGSARLIVKLPIRFTEDAEPTMVSMELYVLITDYVSHSLAYSCVNIDSYRRAVGVWKLSRTRSLTNESQSAIDTFMATRPELYQPYFIQVEQSEDCPEPSSAILVKSSIIIMLVCTILHHVV